MLRNSIVRMPSTLIKNLKPLCYLRNVPQKLRITAFAITQQYWCCKLAQYLSVTSEEGLSKITVKSYILLCLQQSVLPWS